MTTTGIGTAAAADRLPDSARVGETSDWDLPVDERHAAVRFRGRLLGVSSSHRAYQHSSHPGQPHARPDQRCAACRWFEARIFREAGGDRRFLVHRTGVSVVPGEVTRTRFEWLRSGHEVVESLTIRRRDQHRAPSKCPVCDGTGLVSKPPGVAGDQREWGSARTGPYQCHACDGAGVIFAESAFLTAPAARVLAMAAGYDGDLADAYVNRAVN